MKVIKNSASGISRRTLLAGAAIGATQIAAPFVVTARAAELIKIGMLLPKSGPYAVQGETGHNGSLIAVDDFGGHVLDRPIEIVWLDVFEPAIDPAEHAKAARGRKGGRDPGGRIER